MSMQGKPLANPFKDFNACVQSEAHGSPESTMNMKNEGNNSGEDVSPDKVVEQKRDAIAKSITEALRFSENKAKKQITISPPSPPQEVQTEQKPISMAP